MKGTFRKRGCKCLKDKKCTCGATWSYRIDIGANQQTGKRMQKEFHGYKTRKEAEEACAETITQIKRGTYISPSKITVGEFMLEFVKESLKSQVAPNTYEQRLAFVNNHIIPEIGTTKLSELTPLQIQKFYNKLREKYGAGHVQNIGNLLTKAFSHAIKWGIIANNPVSIVKKPPTTRKNTTMKVWTISEQKMFLSYALNGPKMYYALYLLALTSGMRKGELLGLQWNDVDTKTGNISVKRTVVWAQKKLYLKDSPKTQSSVRTVQIPEQTLKILRELKIAQQANPLNLLFPSPKTNGILYPNSLDKQFLKTIAGSAVSRISFHGLRHTFATTLLSSNVNAKIVQEMLGHATIKTTMDTYSHVLPNMQKDAATQLSAVLF